MIYSFSKPICSALRVLAICLPCATTFSAIDPADVLPPITAYYVMRVGRLPLVPYFAPGDAALAQAVRDKAKHHHALLLANHGPVVAGKSLSNAVNAAEELEETAKLYLMLRGEKTRFLTQAQVADLQVRFPD